MNLLKGALSTIIVLAIVIGFRFYNKNTSYNDVRAQMLEFCQGVSKCEAILKEHFDTCFDDSYSMGSRRRSGGLDSQSFVECINGKSGAELLTLNH